MHALLHLRQCAFLPSWTFIFFPFFSFLNLFSQLGVCIPGEYKGRTGSLLQEAKKLYGSHDRF